MIKADVIKYNEERITKAEDSNEVWKIVNEIAKPRTATKLTLVEEGEQIEKEEDIAEIFNDFFITKIYSAKTEIKSYCKLLPL